MSDPDGFGDGLPNAKNLAIEFSGSGREYFRIWIVNLLLIIVTLTLYYPWARVRKLTYLAENTSIDGHPLSFHGQARQMFPGFFIALVGGTAYLVTQELLPLVSVILLTLYLLIWPWLFRLAHRFRLAKTHWRGLAFGFTGSNRGAYAVFLVPLLIYLFVFGGGLLLGTSEIPESAENVSADAFAPIAAYGGLMAVVAGLAAPYLLFLIKRYQHGNFAYASLQTSFTAGAGGFYKIAALTVALAIAIYFVVIVIALVMVLLVAVIGGLTLESLKDIEWAGAGFVGLIIALVIIGYVVLYLMFAAIGAYTKSAVFNLAWSNTRTDGTRFLPDLRFSKLWRLQIKNTILILLTLGLYIPFAQIAVVRLKLDSISMQTNQDLDAIIAAVESGQVSAVADAAADVLDVDIGL